MHEIDSSLDIQADVDDDLTVVSDCGSDEFFSFTAPSGLAERLDKFLAVRVVHVSRETIKRAILDGHCSVDGNVCQEPKCKIRRDQQITLSLPSTGTELVAQSLGLQYIYKDATIAVVNKPAGLTVHPCPSCTDTTLVHGLLYNFPQLAALGGERPGIVHRLDKDTSGVMVVALQETTRLRLTEAFAERKVHKTYLAIVHGIPAQTGTCTATMGRHPIQKVKMAVVHNGRTAHTDWERVYADPEGRFSILRIILHTGRTHQIRVHMQHVGHPLLGDSVYSLPNKFAPCAIAPRQMLHAWRLEIPNKICCTQDSAPESSPVSVASRETNMHTFTAPLPADFISTARKLDQSTIWAVLTGSPGCGKSAVLEGLHQKGHAVCSADQLVHNLYTPNTPLWHALRFRFGLEVIEASTGNINRKHLFALMCNDPAVRHEVNQLVHPVVDENVRAFLRATSDSPIRIVEIPLWFESMQSQIRKQGALTPDMVIAVHCEDAQRLHRLQEHRAWSPEMCATMDSWQLAQAEKVKRSDYVVPNSSTLEALEAEVDQLEVTLKALALRKSEKLLTALAQFQ